MQRSVWNDIVSWRTRRLRCHKLWKFGCDRLFGQTDFGHPHFPTLAIDRLWPNRLWPEKFDWLWPILVCVLECWQTLAKPTLANFSVLVFYPSGLHPSGLHPSGLHFCLVWAPSFAAFCRPKIQHPKIGRSRNWPKSKLAELEKKAGRSRNWPKSIALDTNALNHGPVWKTQSFLLNEIYMVILWQDCWGEGNLRKSYWNMDGRKFQIGNVSLYTVEKGYSYLCLWMT